MSGCSSSAEEKALAHEPGPGKAGSTTTVDPRVRERIRTELNFDLPATVYDLSFLDDGGSISLGVIDADGDTLNVLVDNRMFRLELDSLGALIVPPRHLWLHGYPETPGAVRLPHPSPAESAVVDLVHVLLRSTLTVEEESSLVRTRRRTIAQAKDPHYGESVWSSRLTPSERQAWALHDLAHALDARLARE